MTDLDIEAQCALWLLEEMHGLTPAQTRDRDRFLNETPGARTLYMEMRGDGRGVTITLNRKRH